MAVHNYTYLKLKMPGPNGIITRRLAGLALPLVATPRRWHFALRIG